MNIPAKLDKHLGSPELHSLNDSSVRDINAKVGGGCDSKILEGDWSRWGQSCNRIGNISTNPKSQLGTVYSIGGVSPALVAGTHGYDNYHILVHEERKN